MSSGNMIFCGVDDGFYETKIVLGNGVKVRIPSQARLGELNSVSIGGSEVQSFEYTVGDEQFVIGNLRNADPTAFDAYSYSSLNRVIVNHALRVAGLTGNDELAICTGLPVRSYYVKGKMNKDLILKKRNSLLTAKNPVLAGDGTQLPFVSSHSIVSEGIAAWMDYVLMRNADGIIYKNEDLVAQSIAVIDIGGRTTDIAVISGGNMDGDRSTTVNLGMLNVGSLLKDMIHKEYGFEPTEIQMRDALETNGFKFKGERVDISDLATKARTQIVSRIRTEVQRCLGEANDIDKVLFVGGTTVAVQDMLSDWYDESHRVIVHDAGYANASGMQKYAEMIAHIRANNG